MGRIIEIEPWKIVKPDARAKTLYTETKREQLVKSISSVGIKTPIQVYYDPKENKHRLADGEERLDIALKAKMPKVKVEVVDEGGEAEAMLHSLTSTVRGGEPDMISVASCIHRLVNKYGLKESDIAAAMGKTESDISHIMKLLELSPNVAKAVKSGALEWSKAYEISRIEDHEIQDKLYGDYLKRERKWIREQIRNIVDDILECSKTSNIKTAYEKVMYKFTGEMAMCDGCGEMFPKRELMLRRVCKSCDENMFAPAEEKKTLKKDA